MLYEDLPQPKSKFESGSSQPTVINSTLTPPQINSSSRNVDCTRLEGKAAYPSGHNHRPPYSSLEQGRQDDTWIPQAVGCEHYDPYDPNVYATVKARMQPLEKVEASSGESLPDSELPESDFEGAVHDRTITFGNPNFGDVDRTYSPNSSPKRHRPGAVRKVGNFQVKSAISRMMSKMGYEEGQGLGCRKQGRLDPVIANGNSGRLGLGLSQGDPPVSESLVLQRKNHTRTRKNRRETFQQALCVSNLPAVDNVVEEIMTLCRGYDVKSIHIEDRSEGKCAVVSVSNSSRISAAVLALDGLTLHDKQLRVSITEHAASR